MQNILSVLPAFAWNLLLVGLAILIGLVTKFLLSRFFRSSGKKETKFSFWLSTLRHLSKPFNYFLPLLVLNVLLPLFRVKGIYYVTINKIIDILLMLSVAAVLIGIVKVCEDYVYHAYDIKKADNLRERKIRTQLQFLRRLAIILIVLLTFSFILLSFNNLRKLGAGLLTGVGVGGVIVGFAAQKSLSSFLAGFQIAFTQPIRIDDVLIVENEWGRVHEITLTYVVLKLWDERNLIVPINYFIEKPFQNWTRVDSNIMGTAFFYLDYNVPLDSIRMELTRILDLNPLWDKRVNVLQVTNTSEKAIEVRVLVSAADSARAFDLRCYVREGLINFIRDHYPGSLPLTRAIIQQEVINLKTS